MDGKLLMFTRLRDQLRSVIESPNNLCLQQLCSLSKMFETTGCHNGNNRIKMMTVETSKAIVLTLKSLVKLANYLLNTSHEFVDSIENLLVNCATVPVVLILFLSNNS